MQRLIVFFHKVVRECKGNAAVLSILLIIVIELSLHSHLVKNYISHEVDQTLLYLEKKNRNQPVIVLGDSVGHGIFLGWKSKIAPLACNQATETAGQYFFLKRFLSKNRVPGAVINCGMAPLLGNLNQNLTENYIQRCFTRWNEIYELLLVKKNPVFTTKMIAYKYFATYKYRLHLQQLLIGFTNSNIYSGISSGRHNIKARHGVVEILSKRIDKLRHESISLYFFKKILTELEALQVPLYYLPPPVQKKKHNFNTLVEKTLHSLEKLQYQFHNLRVLSDAYKQMPKNYFYDSVHLNPQGRKEYHRMVLKAVDTIIADAIDRQHELFTSSFLHGTGGFDFSAINSFKGIKPVSDVTTVVRDGQLFVQAHGNDSALLIADKVKRSSSHDRSMVVKITMNSEVKTIAKLYYSRNKQPFSEEKCLKKPLITGSNILFFLLPAEFTHGRLRFDPGEKRGTYVVQRITGRFVKKY